MKERIEAYFSSISTKINIARDIYQEVELLEAPRFNVFDYIDADENKLSDIIADLLRPQGKHGQGNIFLLEFLDLINLGDIDQYTLLEIVREAPTTRLNTSTQRRMDILIKFVSRAIMIENKPWARDQQKQLSDYKKHLHSEFNGVFTIVYLTAYGTSPSEESIERSELDELSAKGQFIQISLNKHIVVWIQKCLEKCRSQNIKHFLWDFKNYLLNNFNTKVI